MDNNILPREKLITMGKESLTDSELLAIMIGSGSKEKSVFELSNDLISKYGLKRLFSMSFNELSQIKGIKEAKATKLIACFEIAKRCMTIINNSLELSSASIIFDYIKPDYLFINVEKITVIYVDSKCRIIKKDAYENYEPSIVSLPVRRIVGEGINNNAYGLFLIHNHPNGDVRPSKSDVDSTHFLFDLLNDINILLLDHIIVSNTKYYSFLEHRILK